MFCSGFWQDGLSYQTNGNSIKLSELELQQLSRQMSSSTASLPTVNCNLRDTGYLHSARGRSNSPN